MIPWTTSSRARRQVLRAGRSLALISFAMLVVAIRVAPAAQAPGNAPPPRPNVLFLFADDERADTIAALGNPHIRTPNLDRLVHEGTAFNRAYCMGSPTHFAVCAPSRAMLLTGRTIFHVKDKEDLKGLPTWPEAFAGQGYDLFLTGKWHNGQASALRIFPKGRAVFFGGMGDPYKLPIQDISPQRTLTNKRLSGEHSVKVFADAAVGFLQGQKGDKPFVCYVPFNLPHDPRLAPRPYHDYYNSHEPPLPANYLPQHPFDNGAVVLRDEELAPWPRTTAVVRHNLADYYAAIEFLDAQIGRIIDALRQTGQYDRTLIVFTADHGLAIGSHGLFGKQNLYDVGMHSPLVIAGPGVPRGRRTDALCYLLDIFPTLGELAHISAPEGSEGISLVPVLNGDRPTMRSSIFTALMNSQRAVRDDRWKLIAYPLINKMQLFDLKNDPHEMRDLAGHEGHSGEVQRLTTLLREWQSQSGDTQPLRSEHPKPAEFDITKIKRTTKDIPKYQ